VTTKYNRVGVVSPHPYVNFRGGENGREKTKKGSQDSGSKGAEEANNGVIQCKGGKKTGEVRVKKRKKETIDGGKIPTPQKMKTGGHPKNQDGEKGRQGIQKNETGWARQSKKKLEVKTRG